MIVAADAKTVSTAAAGWRLHDKVVGLALASIVPALFWTAIVAGVGTLAGAPPSAAVLLTTGIVIAAFLASVVGGLVLRR